MAGNPFRRSVAVSPPVPAPVTIFRTADAPTTPHQQTKTKRVKIESPPHSGANGNDDGNGGERRLSASGSATRAPSPPPPVNDSDDDDDDRAAALDSADPDFNHTRLDTRRNSGSLPPAPPTANMAGRMKAPYNPFARTLATKEADFGLQQDYGQQQQQDGQQPRQRPAMDVDAFKNLLLTGRATANTPSSSSSRSGTSSPAVRRLHDSSSSTASSLVSDSAYTLHPESPRVDHYDYDSHSDDDDGHVHENERSSLVGEGRMDDIAPPAPPKPKSTRGPQTVSFADFDQSIPPNFHAPGGRGTPPLGTQHRGILRPSIQRSVSDLNKPLPPAPGRQHISGTVPPPAVPDKSLPGHSVVPTPEEDLSTPKKLPPPPPASRRQAATSNRPRSASNMSTQESMTDVPDPVDSDSVPKQEERPVSKVSQLPPPLPPPTRMVHPPPGTSISTTTVIDPATSEAKPLIPPPPPRRHPSASNSIRSASPTNSLRKERSSPAVPPPPPPPRRTAGSGTNSSQRSSLDGKPNSLRRYGGGSENMGRRGSGLSIESFNEERKKEGEEGEERKRDVLLDMEAFQKEVDALRVRQEEGK